MTDVKRRELEAYHSVLAMLKAGLSAKELKDYLQKILEQERFQPKTF